MSVKRTVFTSTLSILLYIIAGYFNTFIVKYSPLSNIWFKLFCHDISSNSALNRLPRCRRCRYRVAFPRLRNEFSELPILCLKQ